MTTYKKTQIVYDNPSEANVYMINRQLCRKMVDKGHYKRTGVILLKNGGEIVVYNGMFGYLKE
jgi:hypothetical protein